MFNFFKKKEESLTHTVLLFNNQDFVLTSNWLKTLSNSLGKLDLKILRYNATMNDYSEVKDSMNKVNDLNFKEVTILNLYSSYEHGYIDPVVSISFNEDSVQSHYIVFSLPTVKNICIKDLLRIFNLGDDLFIKYGYSYRSDNKKMGVIYTFGGRYYPNSLFDISRKSVKHYQVWKKYVGNVENGYLRDIYQEQLLKEIHLNQKLNDGSTLKDFIDSSKEHGVLEKLDKDHYIWTVPEDKLKLVRKKLYKEPFVIVGDVMLEKMKKQG